VVDVPIDDDDSSREPEEPPQRDPEAPEADALEQATEAAPTPRVELPETLPFDASEADVLEQSEEVPDDEDDRW
jgi:hypothetical protein